MKSKKENLMQQITFTSKGEKLRFVIGVNKSNFVYLVN